MSIASEIIRIQEAKNNISQAIIDKGVEISEDAKLDSYAASISDIEDGEEVKEEYKSVIEKSVKTIEVPEGTTKLGDAAFYDCGSLTSITIPNSVTSIGGTAFLGCGRLTSITLPINLQSIGRYCFQYCGSLTSIVIPDSVTNFEEAMFESCYSLSSVTLSKNITTIMDYTFNGCGSLTSIEIPDKVSSIGYGCFFGCGRLSEINFGNTRTSVPTINDAYFGDLPEDYKIVVPDALYHTWIETSGWSDFASHIKTYSGKDPELGDIGDGDGDRAD